MIFIIFYFNKYLEKEKLILKDNMNKHPPLIFRMLWYTCSFLEITMDAGFLPYSLSTL